VKIHLNKRKLAEWSSFVIVVVLTLVTVNWLADSLQLNEDYFFDDDEAFRAYEALRVSVFLRDGDLAGASTASVLESL
jgi:hypothetical protein